MQTHHLAQINIGRLLAPIDDPQISEFVAQLDTINRLAESSPGFVWRLQSASGNATDLPYNGDALTIVNMSLWESVESLKAFTYNSAHLRVFRDRKKWFEKMELPHYCLWWVPVHHRPSIAEGRERLGLYQQHGSTPDAFWFNDWHPAPVEEFSTAS